MADDLIAVKAAKDLEERKKRFQFLASSESRWRAQRREDFQFYDGVQWTAKERKKIEDRGQPVITMNQVKPRLDLVLGLQRQLRTRIKAFPRNNPNDAATADAISESFRFIEQNNHFKFKESEVFEDGVIGGRGWFHVYMDFDNEDLDPEIKVDYVPSEDIFLDPFSREYDISDARDLARSIWVDVEEAINMFPDKENDIRRSFSIESGSGDIVASSTKTKGDDYAASGGTVMFVDTDSKRIRLVEYWRKVKELRKLIIHEQLGMIKLPQFNDKKEEKKEIVRIQKALRKETGVGGEVIERNVDIIKSSIFTENLELEKEKEFPDQHGRFPYVPYLVFKEKLTRDPYGFVKPMKDPQREVNKARSKSMHYAVENQAIMDKGAIESETILKREMAKADGIIVKRRGFDLELRDNRSLSDTQFKFYQEAIQELDQTTGINRDLQGFVTNARSGRAIEQRQQSGINVLSKTFDNLRRTRLILGEIYLSLMQQYWTEEKVIRVLDDRGRPEFVKLNTKIADAQGNLIEFNNITTGKYDVIIEEAPDSITLQQEIFPKLMDIVQTGQVPFEVILEALPLPFDIKEKISGRMQQVKQEQAEQAQIAAATGQELPEAGQPAPQLQGTPPSA